MSTSDASLTAASQNSRLVQSLPASPYSKLQHRTPFASLLDVDRGYRGAVDCCSCNHLSKKDSLRRPLHVLGSDSGLFLNKIPQCSRHAAVQEVKRKAEELGKVQVRPPQRTAIPRHPRPLSRHSPKARGGNESERWPLLGHSGHGPPHRRDRLRRFLTHRRG